MEEKKNNNRKLSAKRWPTQNSEHSEGNITTFLFSCLFFREHALVLGHFIRPCTKHHSMYNPWGELSINGHIVRGLSDEWHVPCCWSLLAQSTLLERRRACMREQKNTQGMTQMPMVYVDSQYFFSFRASLHIDPWRGQPICLHSHPFVVAVLCGIRAVWL